MTTDRTAPSLTVSVVAARLGIAPATLRTWDRRYGLGPSDHSSGAHRRYNPSDIAQLEAMRALVLDGVRPGEAARVVLEGGYDQPARRAQFPDRLGALPQPDPSRPVADLPGAADLLRGMVSASLALDAGAVQRCLDEQLGLHGVLPTWEHLVVPLLIGAGVRWETTDEGVEVEHLLSECVATALRRHASPMVASARPVLLACAPGELHALPLLAVGAGLSERGLASRLLGAAVPAGALQAAVRRTGAAAVFVWAQLPVTEMPELPVTRPPTAVVVGGPGWPEELPAQVTRAQGLGAALDLMGRAVRGEALASPR